MSGLLRNVFNYLVPSSGTTNAYTVTQPFDGEVADFGLISSTTGQQFCPSGVMIDNSAGSTAVTVKIMPLGFTLSCPAGAQMGMQYPAMLDHTAVMNGGTSAILTFVDFPVIPYLFQ